MRVVFSASLIALVGMVAACSTEFDPRAESDRYYSLWGALDASADTQWVRITDVREISDPNTEPLDAQVTLIRLETGAETPMRDSLLTFPSGFTANTFWTTATVAFGETYRIDVRRPDGATTRATVVIPDDYTPEVTFDPCLCPTQVIVRNVEKLVDVIAVYRERATGRRFEFSKRASIERRPDGSFVAGTYYGDDALEMGANPLPDRTFDAAFRIAVGTNDWPDVAVDAEGAALPINTGRIENGVGFVGGTVTKWRAFAPGFGVCPALGGPPPAPCFSPQR